MLCGEEAAELDEGAHDVNAGLDSDGAIQNTGQHDGAMFGEGERAVPMRRHYNEQEMPA